LYDVCVYPLARKGVDHKAALPSEIGFRRPVLERAAPAFTEMFADRRNAIRTWFEYVEKSSALALPRNFHSLTRKRQRNMKPALRCFGDTVALAADGLNPDFFAHGRAIEHDCKIGNQENALVR
jgi:hypothetical protein